MCSRLLALWTSLCSERRAQATVEAAILIPVILTVLLLVLQPTCLLYTRAVMESAAAQTCRLMVTSSMTDSDACKAFALRRLAAVPDLSLFHAGGPLAWDISLIQAERSGGTVRVEISGAATPLPVFGAFAAAAGPHNGVGDVIITVVAEYRGWPAWLEGSYETWVQTGN